MDSTKIRGGFVFEGSRSKRGGEAKLVCFRCILVKAIHKMEKYLVFGYGFGVKQKKVNI